MPTSDAASLRPAPPRILVVGDVMTDVIVRPEGPLARGSDRRARIAFRPGGSAANQAAWLASFGATVDFVACVGAADVESETARFKAIGARMTRCESATSPMC
jgi:sugar/nucleoside kinase (ribokinase family)